MSGFDEEPFIHEQGACEINTFVDHNLHQSRKMPGLGISSTPLYPTTQNPEFYNVKKGDIVVALNGAYPGDKNVYATTTMCGTGADELSEYPNDEEMAKMLLESKYRVLGIASTDYTDGVDAKDQGFVTQVAGLHSVHIMTGERFETGCIVRAELLDPNPETLRSGLKAKDGRTMGGYPWKIVPEDYQTTGNLLMSHMNASLEDNEKWRRVMSQIPGVQDRWAACTKAEGDSAIMNGLLFCYAMANAGYITFGTGGKDDLTEKNGTLFTPTIAAAGTHESEIARFAELLGVQMPSSGAITNEHSRYFDKLRRKILLTQFYSGKFRNFEFGSRRTVPNTTRDPKTGQIDTSKSEGKFLYNQLNHTRRRYGAVLQALDDHKSKRLGYAVSAPSRKKRVNIIINKSQ